MLAPFAKCTFQTLLRLSLGGFLHAEAINICIFPQEIKINFGASYTVFEMYMFLTYKIVCYSIPVYKFLQCFASLKKIVAFPFFSPLQQNQRIHFECSSM